MKRIVLPLLVSLCFFSESLFVQFFPRDVFGGRFIIAPHFLLVMLLLMGIYYLRNQTYLYAFIFGLIFDITNTGIMGVYLFLFPLAVYITSKMMKVLQSNILIAAFVTIFNVAVVEFLVYGLNILINHVTIPMVNFINLRLGPTLIASLVFFIIFSYPLKIFLERRKKEILDV
ncbi:rod shape-determining protein MreD [Heyndrickxia sp. NPDC080065]|uniref:rod shape-determining protein MreD n=1 Tax=Heyndrickxia sp. NPDC080065 TaxID=3390568 RepID=UPI003D01C2B8